MLTLGDWLVLVTLACLCLAAWGSLAWGAWRTCCLLALLQRSLDCVLLRLDTVQAETIRSQLLHNAHATALAGLRQSLDQAGLLRGPLEG